MAARVLRKQEVVDAVKRLIEISDAGTMQYSANEHGMTLMPGDILVSCTAEGKLDVRGPDAEKVQIIHDKLIEIIMDMPQEPARALPQERRPERSNVQAPARSGQGQLARQGSMPSDAQVANLSIQDIITYLCPKATEQEAYLFLQLCKARDLNPFLKDAYLIKYSESNPATMVVGKDHFTKIAEKHPQFDGFEAGIILKDANGLERREGTFYEDGEELVGGWAKVWRKDRKMPFVNEVRLKDFARYTQSKKSPWDTMEGVMIRKVPLVQSLREAFPNDLGSLYDRSEMDQAIDAEYEVRR